MSTKKNDTGFLVQGSILAIASIVSRVVGLLYRLPLVRIIGKSGNDYYGTAFEIYSIMLIISAYSIPLAVSKLVAAKVSAGEFKNVNKILKGSLLFASVTGGTASLVVFFGADFFCGELLRTPFANIALRVLAPVIFMVAIVGVLRGFFQGMGTMMPSALSQIAEQIINAVVSVVAAYFLFDVGMKMGGVLGHKEQMAAAYGAAGGTWGTFAGAATALAFMVFVYAIFKRSFDKKIRRDKSTGDESYKTIMWTLFVTIVPVLLSTTLYNISAIINTGMFKQIANAQGYAPKDISEWWGVFTGQYRVIINVPVSIASAMAASSVPALTAAFRNKEHEMVKFQITSATRFVMIIAFPCMIGVAVLAGPIMQLLFGDSDPTSAYMLMVGCSSIVFYSLSTLSNGILQGIDKMKIPVIHAAVALVIQAVFLVLCMYGFKLNIFAVVLANTFYALIMCILNEYSIQKYSGTKLDLIGVFAKPFVASLIMGGFCLAAYYITLNVSKNNAIACVISIIISVPVYFFFLLFIKGIGSNELSRLPKGDKLVAIAKRFKLL
ncbi:MAG: polysaccharide biosynthesis protein [Lachnospiraceae bacterium]|nr:polysaccharide biosynthesis protein [Lachnospiraceae bacterium]